MCVSPRLARRCLGTAAGLPPQRLGVWRRCSQRVSSCRLGRTSTAAEARAHLLCLQPPVPACPPRLQVDGGPAETPAAGKRSRWDATPAVGATPMLGATPVLGMLGATPFGGAGMETPLPGQLGQLGQVRAGVGSCGVAYPAAESSQPMLPWPVHGLFMHCLASALTRRPSRAPGCLFLRQISERYCVGTNKVPPWYCRCP